MDRYDIYLHTLKEAVQEVKFMATMSPEKMLAPTNLSKKKTIVFDLDETLIKATKP